MKNVVRVGVFLTDMANFAAMNRVYETFFEDPKPVGKPGFLTLRLLGSIERRNMLMILF